MFIYLYLNNVLSFPTRGTLYVGAQYALAVVYRIVTFISFILDLFCVKFITKNLAAVVAKTWKTKNVDVSHWEFWESPFLHKL